LDEYKFVLSLPHEASGSEKVQTVTLGKAKGKCFGNTHMSI